MIARSSIRVLLAAALLSAAGCAYFQKPLAQVPLSQDELDAFVASGRDARYYGITTYQDPAGARFESLEHFSKYRCRSLSPDEIPPRAGRQSGAPKTLIPWLFGAGTTSSRSD